MMTHVCDYCGSKFNLLSDDEMVSCDSCGEQRMYNLAENRKSRHYVTVGHVSREPVAPVEEEEETPRKKTKKQSKDVKAKRTSPSYAEQVKSRYGYKRV